MPGAMNEETISLAADGESSHLDNKVNGTSLNGQSEDSSQSNDSVERADSRGVQTISINKAKDNMDGFEIVMRNGTREGEDRDSGHNGTSTNGATENGDSRRSSVANEGEEEEMETDNTTTKSKDGEDAKIINDEVDDVENEKMDTEVVDEHEESIDANDESVNPDEEANDAKGQGDVVTEETPEKNSPSSKTDGPRRDEDEDSRHSNSSAPPAEKDDGPEDGSREPVDQEATSKDENGESPNNKVPSENDSKDPEEKNDSTREKPEHTDNVEPAEKVLDNKATDKNDKKPDSASKEVDADNTEAGTKAKKAPPSPKRKQTKVDCMLAGEKGTSSNTGSENLRPFAKLLFDLGLDLSRQQVYKDLIKVQKRKHNNKQLCDKEETQLDKLQDAYDHLLEKNKSFSSESHKCPRCNFKSGCVNALELHKEYEHSSTCAICGVSTKNIYSFYFHMESEHNRQGRVQPVMGQHFCPYCPYEHHSSRKNFLKHLQKCQSHFSLSKNLQPVPADCDIPLKHLPSQASAKNGAPPLRAPPPLQKKPDVRPTAAPRFPAATQQAKPASAPGTRQVLMPPNLVQPGSAPWAKLQDHQGPQLVQVGSQYYLLVQQNGQTFMTPMTGTVPSVTPKPAAKPAVQKAAPPPAVPQPAPTAPDQGKFQICEICGGFVKDRESLRIHFFWAHKIEIHPSVMKEKEAALKCDHCSNRFWTYQGHKRHVQTKHPAVKGVTPSLTCYVCTQSVPDFITHMTSKHPQVVKHMLSQIRCVVCQDAFQSETALESHMLLDHKDVVTKYGSLGTPKSPASANGSSKTSPTPTGLFHNATGTRKCSRCNFAYTTPAAYRVHFQKTHALEKEPCPVCDEEVVVGRPFISHMTSQHMKKLSISLLRCDAEGATNTSGKRKRSEEVIVIDLDKGSQKKVKLDEESASTSPEKDVQVIDDDEMVADDAADTVTADNPDSASEPGSGSTTPKKVIEEEIIDVDGEKVVVQKVDE